MAQSGARKAALLLASLDAASAAELLKAARPELVTQIAAELAYVKASGAAQAESAEPAREFVGVLSGRGKAGGGFVRHMLENLVGRDKSQQMLKTVQEMLHERDPFMSIRAAPAGQLARALEGESGQVAALVMSELPADKSAALLELLDEPRRVTAIRGMTGGLNVSGEAKLRVANAVQQRLATLEDKSGDGPADADRQQQLRKVAVLLRGLGKELQDNMIKAISEQDKEAAEAVMRLMVVWEDVAKVADRPMQEALRGVDSRGLALAMIGASPETVKKVRANISERAVAMLEEEASLLSSPKKEDIAKARDQILEVLRELNANGFLSFVE